MKYFMFTLLGLMLSACQQDCTISSNERNHHNSLDNIKDKSLKILNNVDKIINNQAKLKDFFAIKNNQKLLSILDKMQIKQKFLKADLENKTYNQELEQLHKDFIDLLNASLKSDEQDSTYLHLSSIRK